MSACTSFFEIPIETPIQPKLDVSAFQRVLVAGFLAGGTEDVDANLETVRLLRSQLRTKSELRVIDADVLPLLELAVEQRTSSPRRRRHRRDRAGGAGEHGTNGSHGDAAAAAQPPAAQPPATARRRASRTKRISSRYETHLRQRRLLEEDRRGISRTR